MACWYCMTAGIESGPYSEMQLVELIQTGDIGPDTLIREGAGGRWSKASECDVIRSISGEPAAAKDQKATDQRIIRALIGAIAGQLLFLLFLAPTLIPWFVLTAMVGVFVCTTAATVLGKNQMVSALLGVAFGCMLGIGPVLAFLVVLFLDKEPAT